MFSLSGPSIFRFPSFTSKRIPQTSLSLSSFWSVMFSKLHHESAQRYLPVSWSVILCAVTLCVSPSVWCQSVPRRIFLPPSSLCNRSWPASLVLPFSASSQYPVQGCSLHFTIPVHKISGGNSKGCTPYLLIKDNQQLNNFYSKILPQRTNLFACYSLSSCIWSLISQLNLD